jgi:uncharacterized protein DUF1566
MATFQNELRRRRSVGMLLLAAGVVLMGGVTGSEAALTTPSCLAKKLKEWGKLRNCQAIENGKAMQGKPADVAKCKTKFDDKLGKLNTLATAAGIACRYQDNADGTVTDFDTGLQWEQKTDDGSVHDTDNDFYPWTGTIGGTTPSGSAFTVFLGTLNNGTSSDATATSGCFAGHCDWRLPAIEELTGIFDCSSGSPCIDQVAFGPMRDNLPTNNFWSATTSAGDPTYAWLVNFMGTGTGTSLKMDFGPGEHARAVRSAL